MSKTYIIIFVINIILIILLLPLNNIFSLPIIKRIITPEQYQKLFINYDIAIKLPKNNINEKEEEYLINITHIPQEYVIDLTYKGKIIKLNNSNLDIYQDKFYKNKILLIKTNETFNNYINKSQNIKMDLIKVIIVPENIIDNLNITSKNYYEKKSLIIIVLKINIFEILEMLGENANVKIMSKKYDIFPYIFLNKTLLIILLIILLFLLIYKCLSKVYFGLSEFENSFSNNLSIKFFVLTFNYIEMNEIYFGNHFKILSFFRVILIISNRGIILFLESVYFGKGINFIDENERKNFCDIPFLIIYFTNYILLSILVNPSSISTSIFINIILLIPIFSKMINYSINNILFLFKTNSVLYKNKRLYKKYISALLLKLFIVIIQLIFLLFIAYIYLCFQKYFVLKKGFSFVLEKDILFQILESIFVIFLALLYIPRKMCKGFILFIKMIKVIKNDKIIKMFLEDKNYTSIDINSLNNKLSIIDYIQKNSNREYIVLNPKVFYNKNKIRKKSNNNIIKEEAKNEIIFRAFIKIGKLKQD